MANIAVHSNQNVCGAHIILETDIILRKGRQDNLKKWSCSAAVKNITLSLPKSQRKLLIDLSWYSQI